MNRCLLFISVFMVVLGACTSAPAAPTATVAPPAATATAAPPVAAATATPAAAASTPTLAPARAATATRVSTSVPTSTLTPATLPAVTPTPAGGGRLEASLVDVDGHHLYLQCEGTGSPTVLLEHGLGGTSADWAKVQPEIAQFTRVCAYDRAGLGQSSPGPVPRTSQQIVDDLHRLLVNAGSAGPYVLVGHSFGGMNVRLYAHQHTDKVAGLVFIDAAHPDQWTRWQQLLPLPIPGENPTVTRLRTDPYPPSVEQIDLARSTAQVRATGPFDSLPLVVVTTGQPQTPPDLPSDLAQQIDQSHHELQQELARLSLNSIHVIAKRSEHSVQQEQPQLVVTAIHQVVIAARDTVERLPPCELVFSTLVGECVGPSRD